MNVATMRFDPEKIAQSLMIETNQVIRDFRDGRNVARLTERWSARIFNLILCPHDQEGHDAIDEHGEIVSIRTVTKNPVKLQKSINIGGSRRCTSDALLNHVRSVDKFLFVDITSFPFVRFNVVSASRLASLIEAGLISPNGIPYKEFYFITSHFQI